MSARELLRTLYGMSTAMTPSSKDNATHYELRVTAMRGLIVGLAISGFLWGASLAGFWVLLVRR